MCCDWLGQWEEYETKRWLSNNSDKNLMIYYSVYKDVGSQKKVSGEKLLSASQEFTQQSELLAA